MAQPLLWEEPPVGAPGIEQATFRVGVGTVTFLLADVEQACSLERDEPGAPDLVVAELHEVVEAAVARHGGVRPAGPGAPDGAVAAFAHASHAVAAALDAQVDSHTRRRVANGLPALRLALLTAEGLNRDDGTYFGHAVRRCARLLTIAHPGQTVLSRATRDLAMDRIPHGASIVDLGIHRLSDLGRPEHVFGLVHRDLPSAFPPPRSLDAVPNNLPSELTSFVGRCSELSMVALLRRRVRLLTLTGGGGCGKTRLALQAAADELQRHPDGVWWVELARLADDELLPAAVMDAIGLHDLSRWATIDTLVEHLRPRVALLLLDNCEHLLDACGALVETLLSACPSLTILATSRAPLGIPGETTWRVPSMSLPGPSPLAPIDVLRQSDAVRLFVDRARQVCPDFVIAVDNAPAIAQICSDLDGIPLAVELAAARVRMLSPEQIERGLGDRFHLLTGGSRTVLPRHQTLRASIDWSYELLDDAERVLLRRLSVFAGGWTLEAAEQVCTGDGVDRSTVLDLLAALVDKSLVSVEEGRAAVRYRLLETVRQYAAARLADEDDPGRVRARHLAWAVEFFEAAEPEVMRSGTRDLAFGRVAEEIPNARAAVEWAAARDPEAALRIANALHLFWLYAGRYGEGDAMFARALDAAGEMQTPVRGLALAARAHLGLYGGLHAEAPLWAHEALGLATTWGDVRVEARASDVLGMVYGAVDPAAGRPLLERSVELATLTGDDWCRVDAGQFLAWCWIFQDEFARARSLLDEAREVSARVGYRWGNTMHWLALARMSKLEGRLDDCAGLLRDMIAVCDEVGDPVTRSMADHARAWIGAERGRAHLARDYVSGSLADVSQAQAGIAVGFANQSMARIDLALGDLPSARRHLEIAVDADRSALVYFIPEHLSLLGTIDRIEGDARSAFTRATEALQIARRIGSGWLQSWAERLLCRLALDEGDAAEAERYAHDALAHLVANGLLMPVGDCLELLSAAAAAQGRFEEAARLTGAAAGARQQLGTVRLPPEPEWSGVEDAIRGAIGADTFDAHVAAGLGLGIDEAVGYVRRTRGERRRPASGWESLTPTETEVVRHAARGLTNVEIGKRMFISRGTVKVHLSHVFAKLGVVTRAELAAEAARREPGMQESVRVAGTAIGAGVVAGRRAHGLPGP